MLLPDKKHKLLTNIKRRNLNPRWNEVFAFEGQNSLMCYWYIRRISFEILSFLHV